MTRHVVNSPLGPLLLQEHSGSVTVLKWVNDPPEHEARTPLMAEAARQLAAYFAGDLKDFDLPLAPQGSEHDLRVWEAMAKIPHGETVTYGTLAQRSSSEPRAVGQACGANPLPIIIPCHRVLASDGTLGGYSGSGGLTTKRWLLTHESAKPPSDPRQGDLF